MNRRFDVAALRIVGLAWKVAAALSRVGSSGEDRDSVPALLAVPNSAVPSLPDCTFRELVLRRLEFLKAHHVRCSLRQPPLENRQAPVHSVDVEGGDPHSGGRRSMTAYSVAGRSAVAIRYMSSMVSLTWWSDASRRSGPAQCRVQRVGLHRGLHPPPPAGELHTPSEPPPPPAGELHTPSEPPPPQAAH